MKHLLKKITILILFFGLLFVFFISFYNQKGAKAQETVICDKEIPIGESMDKTYEFLIELIEEHQKVYEAIPDQAKQAEEMVKFAEECDTRGEAERICIWPCCKVAYVDITILGIPIKYYTCIHQTCVSTKYGSTVFIPPIFPIVGYFGCEPIGWPGRTANDPGNVCPTKKIYEAWDKQKEYAYSEKETVIDGVIGSSGNIIALVQGGITLDLEIRTKINEESVTECLDGGGDCKKEIDKKVKIDENIKIPEDTEDPENPRVNIKLLDYIARKLAVARQEFTNCALTPEEINALLTAGRYPALAQVMPTPRQTWPRWVWPTNTVIDEKIYRLPERLAAEKEKGGCKEICGENYEAQECFDCMYPSLLNYYCCH